MNACECLAALFAVVAAASSENFQCLISLPETARRFEIKCIYSCLREHNVRLNGAWGPYITHLNKEEE